MSAPGTNPRLRVLHSITHLALGGAERVALDLVRGLQTHCDSAIYAVQHTGGDAVSQAMHRELAETNTPLFTGTRIPLKWGGLFPAAVAAARTVRAFRPDIIHLHTEIPEAAIAAMSALHSGPPQAALVRTVHNTQYWAYWPNVGAWCDRRLRRSYVAAVSRGAVEAFERLRARSQAGPPPAPPIVIFNAVTVPAIARPLPPRNIGRLRLLFAGRFERQKGADLLPAIVAQVRAPPGVACELTLYGTGALGGTLRAFAAAPPPGWNVQVGEPVAGLAFRMPEFDVVLMPSRFEGLSLMALEAMLLGVPLIATDAPGLREQLPPDHPWRARAGDASDFARVLQKAIDARGTWPAAAAQAQAFARANFDPPQMFAAYRRLYDGALPGCLQQQA